MLHGLSCNRGLDDFLALEHRASQTPDAIALLAPGRDALTYQQFWTQLQTSRNSLAGFGVETGDVIALALPGGLEFITSFLAAASLGSCAPLDPSLTEGECRFCLTRVGAQSLIVLRDNLSGNAANAARSLGIRIVAIDPPAGTFELADAGHGSDSPARRQTGAALLLFTSASTDSPKLVPLTWSNLRAMAVHDSRALELRAPDRLLSMMPLFHLHGLATVLTQLSCGGSVIGTHGFEPGNFLKWLTDLRPTWFTSSPAMNRAIIAFAHQHPDAFRDIPLRFIRSGTAALDSQLLARLEEAAGVPVLNGYGMTETGGIARNTREHHKPGSVGRSSGLELAVIEGEIVVRGPSVTSGYLDNPEANESAFRDGWFHTGDLGHLDAEGFLFITGRLKEMINRGGKKIAPQEVEAVLVQHPAVAEAAACAIPHATLGEDVGAAVVLQPGASVSESELRQFSSTHLSAFKVPRRIVLIDSIPRTATGKPKRGALAEQLLSLKPVYGEPSDRMLEPAETVLIDIWQRVLNIEHIEVNDNFFALGGDSLSAAAMLTEARHALGTNAALLDRVDFFDSPTIRTLARIVAECSAGPSAEQDGNRILAMRATGSRTPFFCFPASAQPPYYLRHFSKALDADQPFFVVCPADPVRDKRLRPVEELAASALKAIRAFRPHGPYIIGGHCYGGVVAFETARQLLSQGEQVECLVLFDANTPGYPKVHKELKNYAVKAGELGLALGRGKISATVSAVRDHVYALGRIFARRRKGAVSRALTAIGSDVLVAGQEEKTLNGMAMWEYTPADFPAPMIHFIAADQPVSTEVLSDPRLGWSDVARAGCEVRHVRGDHNSILAADNAVALADRFHELRRPLAHAAAGAGD